MSVLVGPEDLEHHVPLRPFAYVISSSSDGVHVIAVRVEVRDGILDCSRVGSSTRRNIGDDPRVTVVLPPALHPTDDEFGEYSLVIDGTARSSGDSVLVDVRSAVLHRPA